MHAAYIVLVVLYEIVVIVTIIHVVMDNRQPTKTMAWVLVIYFVPVVGMVLYFFFGVNTRKERLISKRSLDQLSKRSMLNFVAPEELNVSPSSRQVVGLFARQNMDFPFKDNKVEIITDGYTFVYELLYAIAHATQHIHIDIYIIDDDSLGMLLSDALIAKAGQGVEVKVIYDDVGCWNVDKQFFERMREAGIEVNSFLPVHFPQFTSKINYRNHRKIFIIDGNTGFIGGMNIARRYVQGTGGKTWRDTMVKVSGGAVYGLQKAFLVDWYFVDQTLISNRKYYPPVEPLEGKPCIAQVVTSGPVTPYPEIMQGYVRIILAAQQYVYIETPYFLPTEPVLLALKTASLGGIDVRLMVPKESDTHFVEWASRSYLREVMEAGVKVYLYTPGFLHSKTLVSDDSLATCGSTNIDFRSFENNFESNIFFYDSSTARRFRDVFLEDQKKTIFLNEEVSRHKTTFIVRLWESLTRLLAPLL